MNAVARPIEIERPMRCTGLNEDKARAPKEINVVAKESAIVNGSSFAVLLSCFFSFSMM